MTTPVYTSPFTGTVVTPTDVSYLALPFSSNQILFWPSAVNSAEVVAARIIDCVASSSGLSIALPAANQGTVGADILFRNLGANAFTITDNTGAASVTIPVGQSRYFYLIDNTSVAGVWNNLAFGVGTSFADAATLAGAGLTTVNGQLATTQNIISITATPLVNDQSRASTFVWGSGAGVLALPSYASISTGWFIGVRNNGTGQLSVVPTSPSTLNGQISVTFNPGDSGFIFYDSLSHNFYTVGLTAPNNVSFTASTYDVDAIVGNTFNLTSFAPIIQTYIAQSGTRTQTLAVTLPAITQLYILVNNTNQTGYNITFQNQGSSQPPLSLPAGAVTTILSDGLYLYPLTSSSTGLFYAANGTAGAPSFSFSNDTTTGVYLVGAGVLGISANGVNMITVDDSNLLAPLVSINARLKATLINGGTF